VILYSLTCFVEAKGPIYTDKIPFSDLFGDFFYGLVRYLLLIIIYLQGITFELDEEMAADDEDREMFQDIINNSKLSEGYLTLARDIEVTEPKSPEDIYKV